MSQNTKHLANVGMIIAQVLCGKYVSAGVSAVKNRRSIIIVASSFFLFLIIIIALLVSIPTILMQSLLPHDNDKSMVMSVFAQGEIDKTENEKNSFLSNLLDSLSGKGDGGDGEKAVASISGDINYEEVLILYAIKNEEFWEAQEHDTHKIREIAKAFVKVDGLAVKIKPFEDVVTEVGLNTTQQAIALNMYAYNLEKSIDEVNKTSTIFTSRIKELQLKGDYAGGQFILPAPGYTRISSGFGYRIHPTLHVRKLHTGIDFPVPQGTEILAVNSGKVIMAGFNNSYGNVVIIDHGGGITTLYAHNSKLLLRVGKEVKQGEVISLSGNTGRTTGPHLHFEVRVNGEYQDPLDWL